MLKETRGLSREGWACSVEQEYERFHRKMHAQLRGSYRTNGGLPIRDEEWRVARELEQWREIREMNARQIMLSHGFPDWSPPEPVPYDTNGYEHGKKAVMKCGPASEGEVPFK